jgi:hypothetical protein
MSIINFQIPTTESALFLLGNNSLSEEDDGCVFAKDGYIYQGGKRVRKYFSHMEGFEHFWKPVLEDLPRLESLYYKLVKRFRARWAKVEKVMEKIILQVPASKRHSVEVWQVHASPICQWQGKIWLYSISKQEGLYRFSWDWVDIPTEPICMDLGNELYALESICKGSFSYKVANVLNEGFQRFLESKRRSNLFKESELDSKFEIQVNGRVYLYYLGFNDFGNNEYKKLSWPGSNYQIFKV